MLRHEGGGPLPAVQGRYRDYIAWLQGRDREASERVLARRAGKAGRPSFAGGCAGRSEQAEAAAGARIVAGGRCECHRTAEAFAKRERVTLNTLVQGAWAQLLRRHTGQRCVCFGVTVSGRPAELAGSEEMVGLFINTLPVCRSAEPPHDLGAWLRELQDRQR